MKKENKKYYITLTVVSFLFLLLLVTILSFSDRSKIKGSCSINNIEYVNVSPSDCWDEGISSNWCPLPEDIHCDGEISNLARLVGQIKY